MSGIDPARTLAGRSALVTGVTHDAGIGFATARRLAALGADVAVQAYAGDARLPEAARGAGSGATVVSAGESELWAELAAEGSRVLPLLADLRDPDAPRALVDACVERFGSLDILVANHAHSENDRLEELDAESIDRHLQVNVRASLLLASEFAKRFRKDAGGRIVLFTSGQHKGPMPGELAYVASKGALHQLTSTLSDTLVSRGITVNTVNPGPTDTGWASEADRAALLDRFPLGRWGTPDDAARVVTWLASDDAAWVTGQVIDSEGGFRRG